MSESGSFRKVVKGSALFTGGALGAKGLQFVWNIIVIRLLEVSEYGLVALGTTTINMLGVVSLFGLKTAVPRFLAKYRDERDKKLAGEVTGTALACSVAVAGVLALLLHSQAPLVARAFDKPSMSSVFEVLALMLPAIVLIETFSAVFRGLENARAKALFQDITLNLLRLVLLVPLALIGLGLEQVLWIYVSAAWLTLAIYIVYAVRAMRGVLSPRFSWSLAKELLWFSLPLFGVTIMANLSAWTATLTLGYLQPAAEVGRFTAPLRLAAILQMPLYGMDFLFLPVASKLVARSMFLEVQALYLSTTKWAFLVTLPLMMYFLVDAEFVVTFIFGPSYLESANTLRVLVLGLAFNTFTGPNGSALVAFGDTRSQFLLSMLAAVAAVVLCLLLVPQYGALGAALGTAVAKTTANVLISIVLFRKFGVHPLMGEYVKPVLLSVVGALAAGALLQILGAESGLAHLVLFLSIIILTVSSPVLTRTLSDADLSLIASVERRIWGKSKLTDKLGKLV